MEKLWSSREKAIWRLSRQKQLGSGSCDIHRANRCCYERKVVSMKIYVVIGFLFDRNIFHKSFYSHSHIISSHYIIYRKEIRQRSFKDSFQMDIYFVPSVSYKRSFILLKSISTYFKNMYWIHPHLETVSSCLSDDASGCTGRSAY